MIAMLIVLGIFMLGFSVDMLLRFIEKRREPREIVTDEMYLDVDYQWKRPGE